MAIEDVRMQDEQSNQTPSPKPRNSWKRFSIRALLICTALLAILLASWSSQRRLEQEIVHIVEKHEGGIYIDFREDIWGRMRRWCTPFHDSFARGEMHLEVSASNMTSPEREKLFDCLARRGRVNGLDIYDADDEVLKDIGHNLTDIQYLRISGVAVTDDGLACLRHLENLRRLDLSNTSVTGAGLCHLHGSLWLQDIKIVWSKMTDHGVAELIRFRNLLAVNIDLNDQLTEVSAHHLGRIPSLTRVNLSGAGITEDEVVVLWALLPKLKSLNGYRRPSGSSNASSDQLPD